MVKVAVIAMAPIKIVMMEIRDFHFKAFKLRKAERNERKKILGKFKIIQKYFRMIR
jgi:hypothetical protein